MPAIAERAASSVAFNGCSVGIQPAAVFDDQRAHLVDYRNAVFRPRPLAQSAKIKTLGVFAPRLDAVSHGDRQLVKRKADHRDFVAVLANRFP